VLHQENSEITTRANTLNMHLVRWMVAGAGADADADLL
jgi:hypothetical protein